MHRIFILLLAIVLSFISSVSCVYADELRDQIKMVGSATVYPFSMKVAEHFSSHDAYSMPVIDPIGTGGGFKIFCAGITKKYPDIINASRAIKPEEISLCKSNNVGEITEIKLGYDGIVLANKREATHYRLSKQQLFMALVQKIPLKGVLVDNPYLKWNDIDSTLPANPIKIYGSSHSSGTMDVFVTLVMKDLCETLPEYIKAFPDSIDRKKNCALRTDGIYTEMGENYNAISAKLRTSPHAIGIIGYNYFKKDELLLQASVIEGVEPTESSISNKSYPLSRALYIYVKNNRLNYTKGLREFLKEYVATASLGSKGYLAEKGLIPLQNDELKEVQAKVGMVVK